MYNATYHNKAVLKNKTNTTAMLTIRYMHDLNNDAITLLFPSPNKWIRCSMQKGTYRISQGGVFGSGVPANMCGWRCREQEREVGEIAKKLSSMQLQPEEKQKVEYVSKLDQDF